LPRNLVDAHNKIIWRRQCRITAVLALKTTGVRALMSLASFYKKKSVVGIEMYSGVAKDDKIWDIVPPDPAKLENISEFVAQRDDHHSSAIFNP
jgi:hypothetical protein